MPRQPSPSERSRNMALSYSSGHPSGRTPKLPSFRELLPDYLHDEIDSAAYPVQTGSHHGSDLPPASRQALAPKRGSGKSHHPGSASRNQSYDNASVRHSSYVEDQSRFHNHRLPPERQYYDDRAPSTPTSRSRHLDPSDPRNVLPPLRNIEAMAPSSTGRYEGRGYERGYGNERTGYTSSRSSALGSIPQGRADGYPAAFNGPGHGSYQGYYAADRDSATHSPYTESKSTKYDSLGDTVDSKGKKRRGNLPKPTTDILRAWFYEHLDHPYPSEQDKQMFMTRTGLSISQISNWFINARRRHLPALRNQGRTSESERARPSSSMSEDDPDYDTSPFRR
ncbi:homeodomain super [Emydomyces testavorans]|uniref:Homeodomain super n=1 Tax=Emydomyces testavorans TaxID=2070801 RepID=A0AAF0DMT9_9EURO|nr:homeodomain super [Emydomyces testavorans]